MKKTLCKKLTAIAVATMIFTSSFTSVYATQANIVAKQTIEQLTAQPELQITRGQFAMLINGTFKLTKTADSNFKDVSANYAYADDLLIAKGTGYMNGDEKGNVNPNGLLSGADASVIINNLLGFDSSKATLLDDLSIPSYAKPSTSTLIDLTMANKEIVSKKILTVKDANNYINTLAMAQMYSDSPYGLKQTTPQDDFYVYTNRKYLATAKVSDGKPVAQPVSDENITQKQMDGIFSEIISSKNLLVGSDEWNINELYKMYLDNDTRTKSISKLKPYFDEINAVKSIVELRELSKKRGDLFDYQWFYQVTIPSDSIVDAKKYAVMIVPKTPGLGSKDYYAEDEQLLPIQNAYKDYIGNKLEYISESENIEERKNAIYNLVKKSTTKLMPAETVNDPKVLYTKANWDEMLKITKTTGTLTKSDKFYNVIKDFNLYVPNIEYIKYVESLYTEENLQTLKDMATLSVLSSFDNVLGDDYNDMYNGVIKAMYGYVPEMEPIEKRARYYVTTEMQNAFTNIYVKKYGYQSVKQDVTEMVELIRDKYRDRINDLTWMSDETKKQAIIKLNAIKAEVAFPDEPLETLSFKMVAKEDGGNLIDTALSKLESQIEKGYEKLKKTYDLNLWEVYAPSTYNAFYVASVNKIYICNGILIEPLYNDNASREENLARIGMIIAHEFTHAFDNVGAQYDKDGTLTNWWTEEDYVEFNKLTDKMSEEIEKIKFIENKPFNGKLTRGEAIADLGGFTCVMDIIDDNPNADLSKAMTTYSNSWSVRMPLKFAENDMVTNVHLPHKVRVNFTLSQLEEFYKSFNVTEKDGMYIPKENRVKIW